MNHETVYILRDVLYSDIINNREMLVLYIVVFTAITMFAIGKLSKWVHKDD